MRIAVQAGAAVSDARLRRALAGLAARGHEVLFPGPGWAAPARLEVDVVVGDSRVIGAAWLTAVTRARATVLALSAPAHRAWGPLARWAWSFSGAYALIDERALDAFLAQVPAADRERLAFWPGAEAGAHDIPSTHPDTQMLERCCERALARRMAGPGRAALFVDRDGTLITERHHLADPAAVELLPGVAAALRSARSLGHPVVVISNQAGVGRGLFPETMVYAVMARLRQLLRAEGVELDAVRYCPHAPDAGCECRKPGARLLLEAAEDLRLWLPDSVMVGDKWIDVEAGHAARAAGVLVRTGHGAAELAALAPDARAPGGSRAELVCEDLPAAVRWFLARQS